VLQLNGIDDATQYQGGEEEFFYRRDRIKIEVSANISGMGYLAI